MKAEDLIGWDSLPKRAQLEVRQRLSKGLGVRFDPNEHFAGLCGALGTEDRPCEKVAGFGTKRDGWGRCKGHEGMEEGLPPWYGVIPEEVMFRIGSQFHKDKTVGRPTHGASELAEASLEDIFARYLEPDEIRVMQLAIERPVDLLGYIMGIRSAGLLRITKYIQTQRQRLGNVVTPDLVGAEGTADRTATTIARLAEARKSYLELDQQRATHGALRDVLNRLSDDDLVRAYRDPHTIARLAASAASDDLLH